MKKYFNRFIPILLIALFFFINTANVFASDYQNSYITLKFGSRGNAVVRLQQSLNSKGYNVGPIDGIYGKMTERAVIKFQIDNKLRIDGIAGKETQSKLFSQPVSREVSSRNYSYSVDLYWLSRLIHAEAEAEPYKGKVAVGNVVLNRVKSNQFSNTVKGVIFEYYKGIPQFSPVAEGTIYNTPSQESIQAAKDALNGVRPVGSATYFFNPDKAKAKWIVENKTYVMRIGNHVFYK